MTKTVEDDYLKMVRAQAVYWLKKANDLRSDACRKDTTAEFDAVMAKSRTARAISNKFIAEEMIASQTETGELT